MSYQPPYPPAYPPQSMPVPGGRPPRPASVTFAAILMFALAALGLISGIVALATMNQIVDRFRDRAALTDASASDIDTFANIVRLTAIITAIFMVLFALILIGLALGNLRGSRVSRILTWIVCGLGVLCGCCGILGSFTQSNVSLSGNDIDTQTAEALTEAFRDAYPDWWLVVNGGLSGLQTLGYIAIAILLALPAANAFFRKQDPAQWQPPAL